MPYAVLHLGKRDFFTNFFVCAFMCVCTCRVWRSMMYLLKWLCMLSFVTGSLRAAGTHWFQLAWMAAESHGSFLLLVSVLGLEVCPTVPCSLCGARIWTQAFWLSRKHSTTESHPLLLFGFEIESCYVTQAGHRLMTILLLQLHKCLDHRPALPWRDVDVDFCIFFLQLYPWYQEKILQSSSFLERQYLASYSH